MISYDFVLFVLFFNTSWAGLGLMGHGYALHICPKTHVSEETLSPSPARLVGPFFDGSTVLVGPFIDASTVIQINLNN